eukprot:15808279-Heterocapsa_arctica.AAC.1
MDLPPRGNIPIIEELLVAGAAINDLPTIAPLGEDLLGDVTPVPELGAPGAPDALFDELQDSDDEAVPVIQVIKKKCNKENVPLVKDVAPDDPKWEVIGDRVVRIYKGTNRPKGVWPE